jgi:hypothetical protein
MIRLGSLAGYPFEGPRLLGGWTPPPAPAVFAILYKPDPDTRPERYAAIYVDHSDDLSAERFPFQHPRAHCWVRRAGSKWKVYICTYEVPGGGRSHREQITRELTAIYQPRCNTQRYDQSWKDDCCSRNSSRTPARLAGSTTRATTHGRCGWRWTSPDMRRCAMSRRRSGPAASTWASGSASSPRAWGRGRGRTWTSWALAWPTGRT